jgi:hypothetical protein
MNYIRIVIWPAVLGMLIFGLVSCGGGTQNNAPDVDQVKIAYTSSPFYQDFSKLDTNHIAAGLTALKAKYPGFLDFYLDTLISSGTHGQYNDTSRFLKSFLTYKDYRNLFDTVNKAFPDTKKYDEQLKSVFRYIKHYDSSIVVPEHVYYFVSGLNFYTAVTHNDTDLGIGLDMFLGRNFEPYSRIQIPEYATIRFTAENIPVWAARAIYNNKYPFNPENQNLLELMIQRGKEIYFLEKVLPELKPELLLGFTTEQFKWCSENEALIYNFFYQNKNNLLFEKDMQKIMRYATDGPTTVGMPAASPGNTGSYIGWRIVHQYAAKTNSSMKDVLDATDARKILQTAQYKP